MSWFIGSLGAARSDFRHGKDRADRGLAWPIRTVWLSVLQASYVVTIFENLVISELLKVWRHNGERPHLYFWRDRKGREVDALLDFPGAPVPLEAKAGETLSRGYFKGLGFYRALQEEAGSSADAAVDGEGAAADAPAAGPFGVLVYGGDDSDDHWGHTVRPWWAVS